MLLVLAVKEWATNLLELRFLVCASLCVFLGVVILKERLTVAKSIAIVLIVIGLLLVKIA